VVASVVGFQIDEIETRFIQANRTSAFFTHWGNSWHRAILPDITTLVERRLGGLHVAAAGFSDIPHDHLDYHRSLQAYFAYLEHFQV
jgi:UDP-N-acetylmuramoylalanine-D-glutamate ligase